MEKIRVCIYLDAKSLLSKTGIYTAVENQKEALSLANIQYTENLKEDYDILHLHNCLPNSFFHLLRANNQNIKTIAHIHGTAETLRNTYTSAPLILPIFKYYLKGFCNHCDHVIAPLPYAKEILKKNGVFKPISIIGNCVNLEKFYRDCRIGQRFRKKLGIGKESFVVIGSGQIIPRKGIIDFLRVARALPEFDFVWFGQLPNKLLSYYPKLEKALSSKPENVHFPGFVKDPVAAYNIGDVFFLPSYNEVQPMVILECSALGMPIVVRNIPPYKGWLEHNKNCLMGNNAKEFIKHLMHIALNSELRHKLSGASYNLARAHSLERIGKELHKLYVSLLSHS